MRTLIPRVVRHALLCLAIFSTPLLAQAPNEFDFDNIHLPSTSHSPQGAATSIVVTGSWVITGGNHVITAPVDIQPGGELRIKGAHVEVQGAVTVHIGGQLSVVDSDLLLRSAFQDQYKFMFLGGLVYTENAIIGVSNHLGYYSLSSIDLLRGSWLARRTTMQSTAAVLSAGRLGWYGDMTLMGGSLFANGLYEGDRTDAVHASGMGDVELSNGTMNVGLYVYANSASTTNATLDLNPSTPVGLQVYGDPAFHQAVTMPFPGMPYRLALANHRVPSWQLIAKDATSSPNTMTLTLLNAKDLICGFHGMDIAGSRVLGGPWASHYSTLPGLPTVDLPGHHHIPPNCSVQLGNIVFRAGPGTNDEVAVRSWALYLRGAATNLSIAGPSFISEMYVEDGHLAISGTGSYDMGVYANVIDIGIGGSLDIANAAIGEFGIGAGTRGLVRAHHNGTVTIRDSHLTDTTLLTQNPGASISMQTTIVDRGLVVNNSAGGSITVTNALPTQATDLQNLDFEQPLLPATGPSYWSMQGMTGVTSTDIAPGSGGANAFQFTLPGASGSLQKQLPLPPETFVTVLGWAKSLAAPGAGGSVALAVQGGANPPITQALSAPWNQWQLLHLPMLTVGSAAPPTLLSVRATGTSSPVRVDDLRVVVSSWWSSDNFANLDFELGGRSPGWPPQHLVTPDCWRSDQTDFEPDLLQVAPGAPAGSRSAKLTLRKTLCGIYKDWTFLRANDRVTIDGQVLALTTSTPGARVGILVGDGYNFANPGIPSNHAQYLPCTGTWQPFHAVYTVPANSAFTRLHINLLDAPGAHVWFDEITVTVTR